MESDQIVEAALLLLDEVGIDALTTRKLAERLGVQQPALYWHFKNKLALHAAMSAEMLRRHHTRNHAHPGEDWRTFILEHGRSFRRALLSYRDGARVYIGAARDGEDTDALESQLACLVDAGFPARIAIHGLVAVRRFVVGCVLEQQADAGVVSQESPDPAGRYPLFTEAMAIYRRTGHEGAFETGLAMIVDGLGARLPSPPPAPQKKTAP